MRDHTTRLALLLAALLGAGCTVTPDVSDLAPKAAGDCPGQKVCGYRCFAEDDPEAGCGATTCGACPAAPPHAAPACGEARACTFACLTGWGDCDGDAANGCERAVLADAANCGACGHACAGGAACVDGACSGGISADVPDTGAAPRGLAVSGGLVAWSHDPPVAGGVRPPGELRWALLANLAQTGAVTDLGHPTWVRAGQGRWLAAAAVDADGLTHAWLVDTAAGPDSRRDAGFVHDQNAVVGLALTPDWVFSAENPWNEGWSEPYGANPAGSGINTQVGDFENLFGVGEGAGLLWLGSAVGVSRLAVTPDTGYEVVGGGGVYFDGLPVKPVPSRIAARSGPAPADPVELYFADLSDGSIWMGHTTGSAAEPWRIVKGDGLRTQMDMVGDERGAYWSDLDRGEIWAIERGGVVHRLVSGVRPWALALDAGRLYWTDVDARAVRSIAR